MTRLLIGLGGHGRVVYEVANQNGFKFDGFVDPLVSEFKDLKKHQDEDPFSSYFLGVGGTTIKDLLKRHLLFLGYKERGRQSFTLISQHSIVSESSVIDAGTLIAHGAIVQTGSRIGENCIINTGAIIEHDAIIEEGCHIAPGAIILGGAKVSRCSLIGSGAVILPKQVVAPHTLIASLTRYKQ